MKKKLFCFLYWFLSCSWGIITTLLGAIVTLVVIALGGKVHRNGYSIITEIGGNWGGLSLGAFAFCGRYSTTSVDFFNHTRCHEFGHSLQNIILGPLFIFIVAIPSMIRYQYILYRQKRGLKAPSYDSIWFEHTATKYGSYAIYSIEQL